MWLLLTISGTGELLAHNLLNPHVVLQDLAKTREQVVEKIGYSDIKYRGGADIRPSDNTAFTSYVDRLLTASQQSTGEALSSPTEKSPAGGNSEESPTSNSMNDTISLAILHSKSAGSTSNTNRFDIRRTGIRVAVIQLVRTAVRVGEQVNGAVEFITPADTCYTMHVSLETTEVVESTLALRSKASIHRATRKVYAFTTECTLNTKKSPFSFTVPSDATPAFVTSGVQLEWRLRFEFVTGIGGRTVQQEDLLEEVNDDERGTTYAALQELPAESFDIDIPIRVYGSMTESSPHGERRDYTI